MIGVIGFARAGAACCRWQRRRQSRATYREHRVQGACHGPANPL